MKRRINYIAKMLLGVSIIMLVAMVLPHHHHKQFFCLEIESCEIPCANTDQQNTDKKTCKDCCITKFICPSPDNSGNQVSPDYTFEVLLFTLTDIYTLPPPPKESKVKKNIFYLEKLYNTPFISPISLRAPPQIFKLAIRIIS